MKTSNRSGSNPRFPLSKRLLSFTAASAFAVSACGVFAGAALASTESDITDRWVETVQRSVTDKSNDAFSYAKSGSKTLNSVDDSDLPSKYDLRDPNGDGDRSDSVVTPVKFQNPWGSCWSFASIAAVETSVLSKAGTTYAATGLDLSELQLADAAHKAAPEANVGKAQAGEGYHAASNDANSGLNAGGTMCYASSMFAAGVGPLLESMVPYKNADGIIVCQVKFPGSTGTVKKFLTDSEIKVLETVGATVTKLYWAGNYTTLDSNDKLVTKVTDWSVDDDLWNNQVFELEDGNVLPSTVVNDENGEYSYTDMEAVDTIKKELTEGRAVSIGFHADNSKPGQKVSPKYINFDNWSHYTYESVSANHAVTIVGYDDDYSADNFNNSAGKKPEGNGAWLVKNSWGSETDDFPNGNSSWGIVENGKHTGYFWLSYYDRSIAMVESFDFDLNSYGKGDQYYIDGYDFMPEVMAFGASSKTPLYSANVFTAEYDVAIRSVSTEVYRPNTTVTYEIYLLDDEATTPTDPEHSTLVKTIKDTYEYGGYHRTTLDESEWLALRKGQRYAVVATQYCNDDNLFYTAVAANEGEPSDADVKKKEATFKEEVRTEYYNAFSEKYHDKLVAKYESENNMTEAEAEQATKKKLQEMVDEKQDNIDETVAERLEAYKTSYYVSKVNAGESFAGEISSTDNSTVWQDWKKTVDETEAAAAGAGSSIVMDNLPIKAYAELNDWASVKELDALSSALKGAKALLKSPKAGMTQSQRSRLQAAVKDAKALLERAGSYKESLANTTPASDEVEAATEALKPAKVRGVKVTGKKGALKVSWKKGARAGVQITYSAKKGMEGAKTVTVKGAKAASKAIKGLKGGKTYYVKLRAYVAVDGKKCYGAWSAKKSARVK